MPTSSGACHNAVEACWCGKNNILMTSFRHLAFNTYLSASLQKTFLIYSLNHLLLSTSMNFFLLALAVHYTDLGGSRYSSDKELLLYLQGQLQSLSLRTACCRSPSHVFQNRYVCRYLLNRHFHLLKEHLRGINIQFLLYCHLSWFSLLFISKRF